MLPYKTIFLSYFYMSNTFGPVQNNLDRFTRIWTGQKILDLKKDKAFVCPDIKPDSFNLD